MHDKTIKFTTREEERTYALLGFMLSRLSRIEAIHETIKGWRSFSEAEKQEFRVKTPIMAAGRDAESDTNTSPFVRMRNILAHATYCVFPNGTVTILDNEAVNKLMRKRRKRSGEITIDDTLSSFEHIRVYTLTLERLEKLARDLDEFTTYSRFTEQAIEEILNQPQDPAEEEKILAWLSKIQEEYSSPHNDQ